MRFRLIYVTAGTADEAAAIGRAMVESRLAACANVFPSIRSIYWWDGAVQEDGEAVVVMKTRAELAEPLIDAVRERHSYDCPAIVALPIEEANPAYLDWLAAETKATEGAA